MTDTLRKKMGDAAVKAAEFQFPDDSSDLFRTVCTIVFGRFEVSSPKGGLAKDDDIGLIIQPLAEPCCAAAWNPRNKDRGERFVL